MSWKFLRLHLAFAFVMCGAATRSLPAREAPPAAVEPAATAPATAPAAAPAAEALPADPSTPRGTLKLLAAAMERGDVDTIRQLVQASTPVEERMLAAQVAQAQAIAQLRAALFDTFGQAAVDELMAGQPGAAQQQQLIDAADESLDGESASITMGQDVYQLKRVGERWVVLLAPMAESIDPQMLDRSLEEMAAKSTAIRETAGEIAAGAYQNTDEVAQALQAKLWVAMMREASAREPGTVPATQPEK